MFGDVDITYLGHSSFKIKGKSSVVVTDPFDDSAGKFPKDAEADILTVSHDHSDHNQLENVGGQPFVVDFPGEYEVKGTSIIGVPAAHDDKGGEERGKNTIYVFEMDGLRMAHLGDLGHKLETVQIEEMGSIDILMVPVGGIYTIDAKVASEVVRQVDPWVVIPMHYQQPGLDPSTFGKLAGVEDFIKEMGIAAPQIMPKLVITSDKLPQELQVIILERKN